MGFWRSVGPVLVQRSQLQCGAFSGAPKIICGATHDLDEWRVGLFDRLHREEKVWRRGGNSSTGIRAGEVLATLFTREREKAKKKLVHNCVAAAVFEMRTTHLRLRVGHEREGDTLVTSHTATAKRLMPISMKRAPSMIF
jgi:hypothetical protein